MAPLAADARAAAFAAGPPKASSRAIVLGVAALLAVAVGGVLLERLFSSTGLNAAAKVTPKFEPSIGVQTVRLSSGTPGGKAVAAFLGTEALAHNSAPTIALVDQHGKAFSFAALRGRVVVVSFFDSRCDDICPVLAYELALAERDLGSRAAGVAFVTVNSDPSATALRASPPALEASGLGQLANAYFLTGPLAVLDNVWRAYGISIVVDSRGQVAHNDLLYFVAPDGELAYRVTPVANESRSGSYGLAPALERRFAAGVATYAAALEQSGARRH